MNNRILILAILLIVTTILPWSRVFFEDDYIIAKDVLELPDSRLVWLAHIERDPARKSGILYTTGGGDSLRTITWPHLYCEDMELVDDSSNIAIGGYYCPTHPDTAHLFIYKLTTDGDSVAFWDYYIPQIFWLDHMFITPDNGYILSHHAFYSDTIILVKIKEAGGISWIKCYDFGFPCGLSGPAFASDSSMYFPMERWGFGSGIYQPMLLRLDYGGNIIAWRSWDYGISTALASIIMTNDSTLCCFGLHRPDGGWVDKVWVAEFDTNLTMRRDQDYDFMHDSWAYYPIQLDNGSIISECRFFEDIGLMLFDPQTFDTVWTVRWTTPGTTDYGGKLRRMANGDYCIPSTIKILPSTNFDMKAIRVDSLGNHVPAVISETTLLPSTFSLSAYPNPFNSSVTIALDGVGARIEIYDVTGRRVDEMTVGAYCIHPFDGSTRLTPTTQEYIWTPDKSLPSGVYLVRATFGDCEMARRVVYLK